jgi:3-hydroxybutyryl-CoA dehydratase
MRDQPPLAGTASSRFEQMLPKDIDVVTDFAKIHPRCLARSFPESDVPFRASNERIRRSPTIVTRHRFSVHSFDDLVVGDEWESPRRTVTEADVVGFAGISGDFNPLHVDHSSQIGNPFGRPVAHGLLGLSIATGLASHAPRVDTLAFLAILEWRFHRPIAFGDTIHVVSTILALEPSAGGRRGVVTWLRRILNQDGQIVQEGRTQTLVRGRVETASPPPKDQLIQGD